MSSAKDPVKNMMRQDKRNRILDYISKGRTDKEIGALFDMCAASIKYIRNTYYPSWKLQRDEGLRDLLSMTEGGRLRGNI